MIKYFAKDKETGEKTELKATVYSQAVKELLAMLEIEIIRKTVSLKTKRVRPKHSQKCWSCGKEFKTTDGRIRNCPSCRLKLREKPELQRECAHCTREFITTDRRVKYCPQCVTRNYFVKYKGAEKIACRACDREICLEQSKPKTCPAIWSAYSSINNSG